ncbi:MAG: amidohydrolase family protein [Dysosmobacter welbionis]
MTAVHCADSNQNICSGVAPVRAMLNEGVKVALGSDIAGGDHLHMFDVVAASIRASKARRVLDNWETDFPTVPEGWYRPPPPVRHTSPSSRALPQAIISTPWSWRTMIFPSPIP